MVTLQHSPLVLCADVFDQVNLNEDPALADLGSGDFAGPRFLLEGNWMQLEQLGGFLQGERVHSDRSTGLSFKDGQSA